MWNISLLFCSWRMTPAVHVQVHDALSVGTAGLDMSYMILGHWILWSMTMDAWHIMDVEEVLLAASYNQDCCGCERHLSFKSREGRSPRSIPVSSFWVQKSPYVSQLESTSDNFLPKKRISTVARVWGKERRWENNQRQPTERKMKTLTTNHLQREKHKQVSLSAANMSWFFFFKSPSELCRRWIPELVSRQFSRFKAGKWYQEQWLWVTCHILHRLSVHRNSTRSAEHRDHRGGHTSYLYSAVPYCSGLCICQGWACAKTHTTDSSVSLSRMQILQIRDGNEHGDVLQGHKRLHISPPHVHGKPGGGGGWGARAKIREEQKKNGKTGGKKTGEKREQKKRGKTTSCSSPQCSRQVYYKEETCSNQGDGFVTSSTSRCPLSPPDLSMPSPQKGQKTNGFAWASSLNSCLRTCSNRLVFSSGKTRKKTSVRKRVR